MDRQSALGTVLRHHDHDRSGGGFARHLREIVRYAYQEPGNRSLVVGLASLLWLLLRTGMKPLRAAYPCQQAAMAHTSAWIGTLALPALSRRPAQLLGPGVKPIGAARLEFPVFLASSPQGVRNGSFGDWLRLSMKELQRAGYPSTLDLDGINVMVSPLRW